MQVNKFWEQVEGNYEEEGEYGLSLSVWYTGLVNIPEEMIKNFVKLITFWKGWEPWKIDIQAVAKM